LDEIKDCGSQIISNCCEFYKTHTNTMMNAAKLLAANNQSDQANHKQ
jgi:hypothetical protein